MQNGVNLKVKIEQLKYGSQNRTIMKIKGLNLSNWNLEAKIKQLQNLGIKTTFKL
jgi:hypothetical protein